MPEFIEVNRDHLFEVLEIPPSRDFVRPEVYPNLLMQDWVGRGIATVQQMLEIPTSLQPMKRWHTRVDVVDLLATMDRSDLQAQGASSITESLVIGYASNMKKFVSLADAFSGIVKQRVMEELPESFASFLRDYMKQKRLNQTQIAEAIGVSQSLVSNVLTGNYRIKDGFPRIVEGLDVNGETRAAVFDTYVPFYPKDKLTLGGISDRQKWLDELYNLDRVGLNRFGFEGVEDFILTRFINTYVRLTRVTERLDNSPSQITTQTLEGQSLDDFTVPLLSDISQKDRAVPVLMRVWAAKSLMMLPEKE